MPVVENAWRTVRFEPAEIVEPESVEDVQRIVREAAAAGRKVKAVGGRHSMNHVFRTAGVLVDLRRMNRILSVDRETGEVEVEGGLQLGDAIAALDAEGLHLPSLGSWHTQSLAGAVATSTHGSSMTHGSFSDIVTEMEAVLGDGSVRRFGDGDALRAMRCSLGRLGIVTKLKLRLTPAFMLHCEIESGPADAAFAEATERARADEWVNMLWLPDLDEACTRVLTRIDAPERNRAARALERKFTRRSTLSHRLEDVAFFLLGHAYQIAPSWLSDRYAGLVKRAFFDDQGVVDKSYRVFLYDQYREPTENHRLRVIMNVEYAFDLDRLEPMLRAMRDLLAEQRRRGRFLNYPRVHVRFAPKRDETLIGLNADRDTAYVGIYVVGSIRPKRQIPLAEAIERLFLEHEGRPHWGKFSYLGPDGHHRFYPGWERFEAIRRDLDPEGVFEEGADALEDLDTFEDPPLGAMLRSIFDRDEYQEIRLL